MQLLGLCAGDGPPGVVDLPGEPALGLEGRHEALGQGRAALLEAVDVGAGEVVVEQRTGVVPSCRDGQRGSPGAERHDRQRVAHPGGVDAPVGAVSEPELA